ncbi:hypothetical protein BT96DRAFT_990230 [Gymnopus androsaceus JB14]|uniref:DUF7587 domain-containing protein n=1 Tax=Gymnopus androsaceus JB14 TaxID=1447944 RepID=A0A6A4I0M7_9AGAR|nr:hypothetical protein BT96DRAFT_990230 [Gymnopus androsaceus JB14]
MEPLHLFRTYGAHSGAAFDDQKGFTARASGFLFDPVGKKSAAKEILQNHLNWNNRHIPSPLISASTSAKAKNMAAALRRRNESVVSIAEILYDPQKHPSVTCYNLCSLAKTLGAVIPEHWKDKDEYVFVGYIPLECVVEVRQVSSQTKKNQPSSLSPQVWPESTIARCDTIVNSTARVSDCGTPSLQATQLTFMMVSLTISSSSPSAVSVNQPSKAAKRRAKREQGAETILSVVPANLPSKAAERRTETTPSAVPANQPSKAAKRRTKRERRAKRRAEQGVKQCAHKCLQGYAFL